MKRLPESFGETLGRLLGSRPHPSATQMEYAINRVWERLHSEVVDAPPEIVSEPVVLRRSWTPKVGLIEGMPAVVSSVVALLSTVVRKLRHGGFFADE